VQHRFFVARQSNTQYIMRKPTIDLSRKGTTVPVPSFILDYTSDLANLLALKRSFTEMFTFWVMSENYKDKPNEQDYSPEVYMYLQELFDAIYLAQQEGEFPVTLSINNHNNHNN
jgi:hypothetical protein